MNKIGKAKRQELITELKKRRKKLSFNIYSDWQIHYGQSINRPCDLI